MNEMWVQQTHTSPDGIENECVELHIATKCKHKTFVQLVTEKSSERMTSKRVS